MTDDGGTLRDFDSLLDRQRAVLDQVASGAPSTQVFEALVAMVEEFSGMRCSLLLKEEGQPRLRMVVGPNIPEQYLRDIAPFLDIAPDRCPCGAAAFLRQPVYIRDLAADPFAKDFSEVAVRSGLRAIWSTPILSSRNEVLGTFAMCYGEPRLPSESHIRLIAMATQVARLVLERRTDEPLLSVPLRAGRRVLVTDLVGMIVQLDEPFAESLGYAVDELRGRNIATLAPWNDHDALVSRLLSEPQAQRILRRYRAKDGRLFLFVERWVLLREPDGRARYAFTRVESATEAAKHPLQRLSEREREVLDLVVAGHTNRQIGARLNVTPASVATYRSRVMTKLGARHLADLMRFAIDNGLYQKTA